MPHGLIEQVDMWAKHQGHSRSEALRSLVEQALAAQPKARGK
jgi:metal-responsive CopG/Arc/MetJ family transcriptional regulator